MKDRRLNIATLLLFLSFFSFSQSRYIDSVLHTLTEGKDDSLICIYLRAYVESESDNSVWPKYNERLKQLCERNTKISNGARRLFYAGAMADAINNEGFLKQQQGKFPEAIRDYQKALEIKLDVKDRAGAANSLNNIGYIYYAAGDHKKGIDFYSRSLKMQEEYDKAGAAVSLVNIANVWISQGDTARYIELIEKSLQYRLKLNDRRGIANCYNSLSAVNAQQGNLAKSFEFAKKALNIFEEIGYQDGIGNTCNQLGSIYRRMGNFEDALRFYRRGLEVNKKIGDLRHLSSSYVSIGLLYYYQGRYQKAKPYLDEGLAIARRSSELKYIQTALKSLYVLDSAAGNKAEERRILAEYRMITDSLGRQVGIANLESKPDPLPVDTNDLEEPSPKPLKAEAVGSYTVPIIIGCVAFAFVLLGLILFRRRGK